MKPSKACHLYQCALPETFMAAMRFRHSAMNQSAVHDISFAGTMMSYPVIACFALRKKLSHRFFGAGLFFNLMQTNSERPLAPW